jgi:protoporphyrinogen oxidase
MPLQSSGPRYGLFATFENGVGSFVDALSKKLPREPFAEIRGSPSWNKTGVWRLSLQDGNVIEAEGVILAVPSVVASTSCETVDPILAHLLAQTPYGDVATVNVAVRRIG